MHPLPIDGYVSQIQAAVRQHQNCILSAAPGAGKSTRVLPALLDICAGDVILLQPRRVAARSIARRIADEQGWEIGTTIGWQVRFERRGNARTRLWVMTEGILARRLMSDPYLEGISCIILDEFHERHLDGDIILSWAQDLQKNLRDDLSLIVMSATMDLDALHQFMPDARCIEVPGQEYPLHIAYKPAQDERRYLEHLCRMVLVAHEREDSGSILVFLPGVGEIRTCQQILEDMGKNIEICQLHGSLSLEQQEHALQQGDYKRVILATNIAETSLTVSGVRTVIDSGRERVACQDAGSGLNQLRMQDISQFSATQRAGRAAREGNGRCIRMWSQASQKRKSLCLTPEIHRVDLAPYVLRLKKLHGADIQSFPWFELPQEERMQQAQQLLEMLGFCESADDGEALTGALTGALTQVGKYITGFPLHPRLARLLLSAADQQLILGATIAAICSERDMRMNSRQHPYEAESGRNDILDRLDVFQYAQKKRFQQNLRHHGIDARSAQEVQRVSDDLLRTWGDPGTDGGGASGNRGDSAIDLDDPEIEKRVARYVLSAWPDRVLRRGSASSNTGKMPGGKSVQIDKRSCLYARKGEQAPMLAVAAAIQGLQRKGSQGNYVQLACAIEERDLIEVMPKHMQKKSLLRYDSKSDTVKAQVIWRYLDLDIKNASDQNVSNEAMSDCLAEALSPSALTCLREQESFDHWYQRLQCLTAAQPDWDLPIIDNAVAAKIIQQMSVNCRSKKELLVKNVRDYLYDCASFEQLALIDREAPVSLQLPKGKHVTLQYDGTNPPICAAKIQDCFGLMDTPRIAGDALPVLMHLLAPNRRPAQVTSDLKNFWAETYAHVRKDLRGRYPKHDWPENPC